MFRAIILPIFRNTRLCVTACGIMAGRQLRGCIIPQTVTHSLVFLKIGKIIARNMLSWLELLILLHLVGCLYYLCQWHTVKQTSDNEIYLLVKYIKSVLWRVVKRLSYKQDARCLKVKYYICLSELIVHQLLQSDRKLNIDLILIQPPYYRFTLSKKDNQNKTCVTSYG